MRRAFHPSMLLAIALLIAGCADIPKSSAQSYKLCRIVPQPGGGTLVIAPEIPFTVRGKHGVTGFQALVNGREVTYYEKTSMAGLEEGGTFEATRASMESYRHKGSSFGITGTGVRVAFSPAYIDGFLRRVDAVVASNH